MKAIALVVTADEDTYVYAPAHVDVATIDVADRYEGNPKTLEPGIGFEELVAQADLVEGKDYVWKGSE